MNEVVLAGLAHMVLVFFKAMQQRNVAFLHYCWVVPTSYFLSAADVFIITIIAVQAVQADSYWIVVPLAFSMGTGGGIGALAAMWIHSHYIGHQP